MRHLIFLALFVVLVSDVHAASGRVSQIFSDAAITADDTDADGICLPDAATDFIFSLDATFNSGTSTLDVKIQHAALGSDDWIDVSGLTFTQVTTASAFHTVNPAAGVNLLPCIRAYIDVGGAGSPNYDAVVKAHYRYTAER